MSARPYFLKATIGAIIALMVSFGVFEAPALGADAQTEAKSLLLQKKAIINREETRKSKIKQLQQSRSNEQPFAIEDLKHKNRTKFEEVKVLYKNMTLKRGFSHDRAVYELEQAGYPIENLK